MQELICKHDTSRVDQQQFTFFTNSILFNFIIFLTRLSKASLAFSKARSLATTAVIFEHFYIISGYIKELT